MKRELREPQKRGHQSFASVALGINEMATIRDAAELCGVTVSAFMGDAAVREARKVVSKLRGRCPHCGQKNRRSA